MKIYQGSIYWASTSDENGHKRSIRHPQVVIQDNLINQSRIDSVVVCEISTNLTKASIPGNILLKSGEGNLPKNSIILTSHISSVKKKDLGEYVGKLDPSRIDEIFQGLSLINSFHR